MLDSTRSSEKKELLPSGAEEAVKKVAELLRDLDDGIRLLALAGKLQNALLRNLEKRIRVLEEKEK